MLVWVLLLILLLFILFYSIQNQNSKKSLLDRDLSQSNQEPSPYNIQNGDKPDWLVQAEKDYAMPMTFPQAADTLATMGYPKSQIEQSKPVIQANLTQIRKDNEQSLEEKKKDPKSNPPRYGITIASIYEPSVFLSKNTGLKTYPPPPPQTTGQPAPPPPQGTRLIVPDKSKILDTVDWSTVDKTNMPVYNQSQCGCCWAIACAALLNYHIRKKNGNLEQIAYPNKYTFCLDPKNGISGISNGCQGGIPTDVFVYMHKVKKIDTFQNVNSNYGFNDKIKDCAKMNQPQGNPTLNVTTSDFPTAGMVTLYNDGIDGKIDGKFYFTPTIDQTFRPTSTLMRFNQEQIDTIKYILSVNGPMVIGMDATNSNINNYTSGVVTFAGVKPDHAVVLLGYKDNYWIIQNSWSEQWGMKGLIYADISKSYLTMMTSIVLPDSPIAK